MTLRNKIFLLVGLVCLAFLMMGVVSEAYSKTLNHVAIIGLIVSFSVITLSILYVIFAKRFDAYPQENQYLQFFTKTENKNATDQFFKYDEQKNTFYKFAHYDKFISLPNRVLFNEILNKSISHAKRHQKILAHLID